MKPFMKDKFQNDPRGVGDSNPQGWARDVKARDRDDTFVALET